MNKKTTLKTIKPPSSLPVEEAVLKSPPISLLAVDPENAQSRFEDFCISCETGGEKELVAVLKRDEEISTFLAAVFDHSSYLFDLARQFPDVIAASIRESFQAVLDQVLASIAGLEPNPGNEVELMRDLRVAKRKAALLCGLADLGGWWSADQVSAGITKTADATLQSAVRQVLSAAHDTGKLVLPYPDNPERGSGYVVLAMGKHGAGELNYSSDIDLIVFFDPFAEAVTDPEESVAVFVRITKALVRIMQERTADGYVFRTDLRLRPDPGSMPLAIPIGLAMNYYESRGQNWERAALIKTRQVAGDSTVGESMLNELSPFIWRRYLDYAAIADVHSIKRQIQAHKGYGDLKVSGHNIKLGRGGIREIEFFVQTQQLIAGGRVPELRGKRTVAMLSSLVEHGWIEAHACDELSESYHFLRDVEHRLQMIADEQIHTLPESDTDLRRIARLCGFEKLQTFSIALSSHLTRVETHYADLFSDAPELTSDSGNLSFTGDDDDPGTVEALASLGYERPSSIIAVVRAWHFGRYPAMQSAEARERLTELTPALLSAFADAGRADETLLAFDSFLKGLPAGFQLFSLLHANPQLLSLLTMVLSSAPRLSAVITRRPHVFDGLLEPGFFDAAPTKGQWQEALRRTLDQARDYEDGLNRARIFAAEQKFLIGIRILGDTLPAVKAGPVYSDLADVMLNAMVEWVQKPFKEQHGTVPGSSFAVIGMGNLGTRELTAGSDLDLMLLYEYDRDRDESDGEKPLHASQYFGRFTQRLIAAMSAPTSDGTIYELDFRLRPSGNDGPIATSLIAFERYHSESAGTWEKLALTRARVLAGDAAFGNVVARSMKDILTSTHGQSERAKDVLEMRLLMDEERSARDVWDIKLAKGGLIDLEFLAQWAVLSGEAEWGQNTADILHEIGDPELQNDNVTLGEVHSIYLGVIQLLRLCLDHPFSPEEAPRGLIEMTLKELNLPDMKSAEAYLNDLQRAVRKRFLKGLKQKQA